MSNACVDRVYKSEKTWDFIKVGDKLFLGPQKVPESWSETKRDISGLNLKNETQNGSILALTWVWEK